MFLRLEFRAPADPRNRTNPTELDDIRDRWVTFVHGLDSNGRGVGSILSAIVSDRISLLDEVHVEVSPVRESIAQLTGAPRFAQLLLRLTTPRTDLTVTQRHIEEQFDDETESLGILIARLRYWLRVADTILWSLWDRAREQLAKVVSPKHISRKREEHHGEHERK
jgi:hypothetical protein